MNKIKGLDAIPEPARLDPQAATPTSAADGVKCGVCGLPIHPQESGVRHFGFYTAHSEHRCISLLRGRLGEAQAALERIAHPPYGLGFNKLRGIARSALRSMCAEPNGLARDHPNTKARSTTQRHDGERE